jgi:hypothetical protein
MPAQRTTNRLDTHIASGPVVYAGYSGIHAILTTEQRDGTLTPNMRRTFQSPKIRTGEVVANAQRVRP